MRLAAVPHLRWIALVALCAPGCTVDLEAAASLDAAPCAASPDYFVSDVWPRYLVANGCGSSRCHDFTDGHGTLRLRSVDAAPAPGMPLAAWSTAWRESYLSTVQLVRCDAPLQSRLLTVPEGQGNLHPPGPIVLDRASAATVIESWIVAPR